PSDDRVQMRTGALRPTTLVFLAPAATLGRRAGAHDCDVANVGGSCHNQAISIARGGSVNAWLSRAIPLPASHRCNRCRKSGDSILAFDEIARSRSERSPIRKAVGVRNP